MKDKFIDFLIGNDKFDDFVESFENDNYVGSVDSFLDNVPSRKYVIRAFFWRGYEWSDIHNLWLAEHDEAERHECLRKQNNPGLLGVRNRILLAREVHVCRIYICRH